MSTQKQPTSSMFSLPFIAVVLTILLVVGGVIAIVLHRLEIADGRNIEDAANSLPVVPLVCGGLLVLSLGWLIWLVRKLGMRDILTIVVAVGAAILLVITPLFAWQSMNSERDLRVVSMTCDAEELRHTGGPVLASCEQDSVDTIVLLQGVESDDQWVPDSVTDNLVREFHDLPGGDWQTVLTVDGPPDTVAVAAVGQRGDDSVRLGTFRPYMDTETERLRWTARLPINDDIETVQVAFYLSANPAIESASIRFDIRECGGQTLRSFDASECTPMEVSTPLVLEQSPEGTRTWRHPHVERQGSEMVITNLEARTYELEPDYANIESYTQSTDVLIIPSAMEQTAENSITEPGASSFDVTIDANTGVLEYTIYIFPVGPTFAEGSAFEQKL